MTVTVTPNQSNVQTALRSFLLAALPSGVEVIAGQSNRVPEPQVTEFVVMTMIRRDRLATNVDSYADAWFTASIAATTLTVSGVYQGALSVGSLLFGTGVLDNTSVVRQLSGSVGGTGTYQITPTQNMASSVVAAGVMNLLQATEVTVQLDCHSASITTASDMAQRISTMLRDDWGYLQFKRSGYDVRPLHADTPKQIPFINAEEQYESRYVVEACLQANQAVLNVPQQFADTVLVGLIDVDSKYAP